MIPLIDPNVTANILVNDMYNNMYNDIHAYNTIFNFRRPSMPIFKKGLLEKVKQMVILNITTVRDLFETDTTEWNFFRDVLVAIPEVTINF